MIVNGFKPLTIIAKHSILDIATALDPPLVQVSKAEVWSITHIRQEISYKKQDEESRSLHKNQAFY